MRDNDLRIIAVLVIIIAFVALGVAFSVFTFPSTTEVSIGEEEEEEEEMELIGVYTAGFLNLYKLHDNKDNLTCWLYNRGGQGGGGISCIPDHLLTP